MAPSSQPNASANIGTTHPPDPAVPHALITRGSAPRGTFDSIPDAGLAISESKSFLARFRAGLSITDSPTLSSPRYQPASPSPQTPSPATPSPPEPRISPRSSSIPHHPTSRASPRIRPQIVTSYRSPSTPSPRSLDIPSSTTHAETPTAQPPPSSSQHQSNADISLLSDDRSTYPVLRFCAANALLDQHALDTLGLPLGFVWAPFGPLPDVPKTHRPPQRCRTCGSFLASHNGARHVSQSSSTWQCVFCHRRDNPLPPGSFTSCATHPNLYPQLTADVIDYVHHGSTTHNSTGRGAIVLIVDDNLEHEEAVWARAAVAAVHASAAERGLRFALLTVGAACSVAVDVGDEDSHMLEVVGPQRVANMSLEEKEQFFLRAPKTSSVDASVDADTDTNVDAEAEDCSAAFTDAFVCARALSAKAELAMEFGGLEMQAEGQVMKTRYPVEGEPRRLDLAIEVAFELILGMADAESSRILSLLTGPPSLPPTLMKGAQAGLQNGFRVGRSAGPDPSAALSRLYEQIGAKAGDRRIALDFLCFGASQGFAGPILLNTSKRSKGGLVYSAAHGFSAASALAEAAKFLSEMSTSPGLVSIRISAPMAIARVIAPAFPTAAPHTYAVPGIDPMIGFTVILKPPPNTDPALEKSSPPPSHAVVQLAAKSMGWTRVITVRIPLTIESHEYLRNLDAEVCALVLGKACVVSGGALTQPHIAARSIDLSARRLLRGSEATAGVVRLLYELRRGLLIDRQVSADCALVFRSFFLRGESGLSSLLMSPRLFTRTKSDENTGLMTEVPLETSYVSPQAILVLDTGFNVFVYVGEDVPPETEQAVSESAQKVAEQRVSPCQLWKLHPGPDAEYLLEWYLADSGSGKRSASSAAGDGFIRYCRSLAPDSITVRLLQS